MSEFKVPKGWKLVPEEPTPQMLDEIHLVSEFTGKALTARYRAMLAAAPAAPVVESATELRAEAENFVAQMRKGADGDRAAERELLKDGDVDAAQDFAIQAFIQERAAAMVERLLAAPAAPVADGTTSDKYRAELYDEVWQRARGMGYGNVTDALVELERLKAAAPVVQAEQGPVAFQCHSCKAQTPPPAPFKWYVKCKECGEKTAATAAAEFTNHAAPPAHHDAGALVEALEHARQFIRNGIDLGFIRMPDADTPDPAHETLPRIDAALSTYHAGKGGAQPAELNDDDLKVVVWGIALKDGFDMRWGSAVSITHIPTGISVMRDSERSQYANKEAALAVLTKLVAALAGKGGAQ